MRVVIPTRGCDLRGDYASKDRFCPIARRRGAAAGAYVVTLQPHYYVKVRCLHASQSTFRFLELVILI
jgi:hypothetical protein